MSCFVSPSFLHHSPPYLIVKRFLMPRLFNTKRDSSNFCVKLNIYFLLATLFFLFYSGQEAAETKAEREQEKACKGDGEMINAFGSDGKRAGKDEWLEMLKINFLFLLNFAVITFMSYFFVVHRESESDLEAIFRSSPFDETSNYFFLRAFFFEEIIYFCTIPLFAYVLLPPFRISYKFHCCLRVSREESLWASENYQNAV